MAESLITGVREFLRAAAVLYGAGDLSAGPPLPMPVSPFQAPTSGMSGAVAAAHAEAVTANNARLEELNNRDALVWRLVTAVGDSHEFGRRAVANESAVFESSVAALGPFATTPFGTLALLPPAAGAVAGVTGQIASSSSLMTDLSRQVPGDDPPEDTPRRVARRVGRTRGAPVVRASSSPPSPPSPQERQLFRRQLANYAGPVPGMDLALSLHGAPYVWGGFSPRGLDCSGAVSALVNRSLGLDPFADRTSTHHMDSWLAARGALPGLGPGLNIGITDAGVGHTAATLPDGTNFESSGGRGAHVGGSVGADHPMFTRHWHIPPERLLGGGASIAI
jgi:cell wall-associated NlpC family hydrolase